MERKQVKSLFPRRTLLHRTRLSPQAKSPPNSQSPYLPKTSPHSRSLKAKGAGQRVISFYPSPRQISLIYTHHRPSRERPRRSSSMKPMSPPRADTALKLQPRRPESLNSSMELEGEPLEESQKLCRNASKSLLLPSLSPPTEPNLSFVKTVFPSYEAGSTNKLLSPEETNPEASESLNFIQEVQASMEHSDDDSLSDSFSKGIGCTEEEFRIRATLTTTQTQSQRTQRSRSNRAPYKKLSLVGLMPLEDLWDQKPNAMSKDRRERAKTYTGAGGFTVAKRQNLLPEIEYGLYPASPERPGTQLGKPRRPRAFADMHIARPHSSADSF